jgi:hypothetical protein
MDAVYHLARRFPDAAPRLRMVGSGLNLAWRSGAGGVGGGRGARLRMVPQRASVRSAASAWLVQVAGRGTYFMNRDKLFPQDWCALQTSSHLTPSSHLTSRLSPGTSSTGR